MAAALAFATRANKGALYEGSRGAPVSFEVSPSGKSITHFRGPDLRACSVPGVAPAKYPSHAQISHGRFTVKEIVPAHSKDSEVVDGRFTARGGVTGSVKVATRCLRPPNFNSGPFKHKTVAWSATSAPAGKTSRYCTDRVRHVPKFGQFFFTNIIEKGTTCKTVGAAIKGGKVTPQPSSQPAFSTSGWMCERSAASGRYACSRRKASFSFLDG